MFSLLSDVMHIATRQRRWDAPHHWSGPVSSRRARLREIEDARAAMRRTGMM